MNHYSYITRCNDLFTFPDTEREIYKAKLEARQDFPHWNVLLKEIVNEEYAN